MSYVLSYANRFYTALESGYGQVAAITAANRIPALKLTAQQQIETPARKDKSGSRTFPGTPPGGRRRTTFELRTYLTTWPKTGTPAYGPLFQAGLGGAPLSYNGGTVGTYTTAGRLGFAAPHGLVPGQAVACGSELRFVAAVVDASTVQLNAPFTAMPAGGSPVGAAVTYTPATTLPSASIFDYWDPTTAVQRLLHGAAVDQMEILVNGDYHEVRFKGLAQDLVDSASFTAGTGASALQSFPQEPALGAFDYTIVPGNLGQAWLGPTATQFCTITSASVVVNNGLETRNHEFGSCLPKAIAPGERSVTATVTLYSMDDANTQALYQAARQQSPISVMFQLGNAAGQLLGVYLKSVVPEVPEFDDSQNRLQWRFRSSRAQGTVNDEVMVAFA